MGTAFGSWKGRVWDYFMPFSLANAPDIFQLLISIVLSKMEGFSMAYLDVILVSSETFWPLEVGFRAVKGARIVRGNNVFEICYKWGKKTVKKVRGFIGAIGYCRRFIPTFRRLPTPLIALNPPKNARFKWTEDCQRTFDNLRGSWLRYPY